MTADRDLPHRPAPRIPDTAGMEIAALRICGLALTVLLPILLVNIALEPLRSLT